MSHSPLQTTPPSTRIPPGEMPWTIAAPSFVRPAGIAENCTFLANHVDEVGLALFETKACLAYGQADLPKNLTNLDLSYHVHLPIDLDWNHADTAWRDIEKLVEKTAFLSPRAYVLHPHENAPPAEVAQHFQAMDIAPERVLLENIHAQPLTDIWQEIMRSGLSVCLDMGHLIAYNQHSLLRQSNLWEHVRMVHLYAPDPAQPSRHAGLPLLDREGRNLLHEILAHLHGSATVMLEVFQEPGFMASLNFFEAAVAQTDGNKR